MEKLDNLPPLAIIVFGATLAVIFAVRYLGLWSGRNATPDTSPAMAQVAAVIVDPTALNKATAVVEAHAVVMKESAAAIREGVETMADLVKAIGHMATETDRIREELRIHREINRRL